MATWRARTSREDTAAAARRRLELLGAQLAAGDRTAPKQPGAPAPPDSTHPANAPGQLGRHLAEPAQAGRRQWLGAVADRLPLRARELAGRGAISGQHVAVLAALLALGLTLTAWWVVHTRPRTEPVPPLPLTAPSPLGTSVTVPGGSNPSPSQGASLAPSPASAGVVIVDVVGKVRHPGIVTLPAGSRVVDAVKAAGGVGGRVDLTTLNLARPLVDGEQLLVGLAPPPGVPGPAPPTSGTGGVPAPLVNLNTATLEELDTLPGIGPVTGQAILDWRDEHGGFTSVDELLDVDGIGEATLADLRDLVTV